ncbi:hypothetical protein NOVO_01515 [Rickettsiales bacterium Ac37b]|nr:hypothetical protein NOVO_01515 [Rickettsiales bacterium Ac37b]
MLDIAWSELLVVIALGWLLTDPKEYAEVIKGIASCMRKIATIKNEIHSTLMEISEDCVSTSDMKVQKDNNILGAKELYLKQLSSMYCEAQYNKIKDDNTTIH